MLGYFNGGTAIRTSPDRWQYFSAVFDSVVSGSKPILLGADTSGFTERVMQDGHIGELIAYEGALSSQDVAAVTDYLVAKWGLA